MRILMKIMSVLRSVVLRTIEFLGGLGVVSTKIIEQKVECSVAEQKTVGYKPGCK